MTLRRPLAELTFFAVLAGVVGMPLVSPAAETTAQQPETTAQQPETTAQQPETTAQQPETTTQQPTEEPLGNSKQPSQASERLDAGWMVEVDYFFDRYLVKPVSAVLFFDFWTPRWLRSAVPESAVCPNPECGCEWTIKELCPDDYVPIVLTCPECGGDIPTGYSVPLVVLWLFIGAIYFTIRMGFINIRGFWHAIRVTKGDFDDPEDTGEVSHFQALASALSATVGLGNIAGVAIAVSLGGPGATLWILLAGLLGMSMKFSECTLGQLYRKVDPDGTVSGGPMHYLRDGLAEIGLGRLGAVLATLFAVVCMGGSFGGGCVFQISQSLEALRGELDRIGVTLLNENQYPWIYGLVMATLAGVVIIGGIRRIAATAEKIVPLMCGVYVLASLYILAVNHAAIPHALLTIINGALTPDAAYGGFVGTMVMGIRRAAFSNEAGLGSASIAHAAAKTDEPVSEGIVALLEPFIDTVVVCTMTGLVIVVTGVYDPSGAFAEFIESGKGAPLTAEAFRTAIWWFPWLLTAAVCLFAYSTLISWSYYGERCWSHLFGQRTSLVYKLIFLGFVVLGSIITANNIIEFSDLMILSMAFPNILGVMLLSGKIRRALDQYWRRYKSGELERKSVG